MFGGRSVRLIGLVQLGLLLLAGQADSGRGEHSSAGETIWGDCVGEACFKLLGPKKSLAELEQGCAYIGGSLGSLVPENAQALLAHWHGIFQREYASQGLLLMGYKVNTAGKLEAVARVPDLSDGDSSQIAQMFSLNSFAGSGPCVSSAQHKTSGSVIWQTVGCELETPLFYAMCEHQRPEHGFCYEVRWKDAKSRMRKHVMTPVPRFPEGHPKVSEPAVCGISDSFGFIPPKGKWALTGNSEADSQECQEVSGGELFYAYNNPTTSSSNTGFDEDNSLVMFFVQDTDYRGYWVVVIDKPEAKSQDSGMLELLIDSVGLDDQNVEVLLYDDIPKGPMGENCTVENIRLENHGVDCYDWNSQTGSGRFIWRWNKCCTDGMVLGSLPSSNFCIQVAVGDKTNIRDLLFANYVDEEIEMSSAIPVDSPLQVCGYECPAFCKQISNCGECASTPGCGWCPSFGCEPIGAKEGCPEGVKDDGSGWLDRTSSSCCPNCEKHDACQTCSAEEGCGWDSRAAACRSGNIFSRFLCNSQSNSLTDLFAFSKEECTSFQPTPSPTDKPTSSPTTGPTLAPTTSEPTLSPSFGPTEAPSTSNPSQAPSKHPSQSPTSVEEGATSISRSTGGGDDSPDWLSWGLPLIIILLLLLASCSYFVIAKRRRSREDNDEFDSIGGMTAAAAAGSSTAVVAHTNPMFNNLALENSSNALVAALRAAKEQGAIIHLYTNCPDVAMELSHEGLCFVKCMEESGSILDDVSKRSYITRNLQSLSRMLGKRNSSEVRVDLKVKKLDEWTRHSNPHASDLDKSEFFYNGKLNQIQYTEEGIKVRKKGSDGEPLRWQFAPDEFDNFEQVMCLLSKAKWRKLKGANKLAQQHVDEERIIGTYFVNPATKDRVWLE